MSSKSISSEKTLNLILEKVDTPGHNEEELTRKVGISGLYVLKNEGKVVAQVNLSQFRWQCEHVLSLSDFVVGEENQNNFAAQELLKKVEEIALTQGIKRIEIDLHADDFKTQKPFEESGYNAEAVKRTSIKQPDSDHPINAIVMGKIIDPEIKIPPVDILPAIEQGKISRDSSKLNQPSSDYNLRKADQQDFQQINEIYRAPHAVAYLYGNTDDDFVVLFKERIAEKEGISGLYVLENTNGLAVATVNLSRLSQHSAHVLYIGGLGVRQNQERGIGTELIMKIEEIAVRQGITRLELEVEADNPRAIGLYTKMGFDVEGVKKGFVKRPEEDYYIDEVVMSKITHFQ